MKYWVLAIIGAMSLPAQAAPQRTLTLSEAVSLALRTHPAAQLATHLTDAARTQVGQAEAGYYPRLFFGAQWIGGSINGNAASFLGFPDIPRIAGRGPSQQATESSLAPQSSYLTGVSAGIPLWDFGRTQGRVVEAEGRVRFFEGGEQVRRLDIILGVRRAYFGVLKARAVVGVARESVTRLTVHAAQSREMVQRGVRPPIELYRTEAELARARGRLIAARNATRVAWVTLDNAIGIRTAGRYRLADPPRRNLHQVAVDDLLEKASRTRPELGGLDGLRTSLKGSLRAAKAGYYPMFAGTASVNLRGLGGVGNYFNYDAGVLMVWPIFEGFLFERRAQEARSRLRGLEASREEIWQRIQLQVRSAQAQVVSARELMAAARVAAGHAEANLKLATARFQAGLSRIIELADAEELRVSTQAELVRTSYDHQIALAVLERAVGGAVARR